MDSDEAVRLVFGMALRQLRTQAGMSLRALGRAAHYDFSRAPVYLHHYGLATLEEQSASGYRACGRAETAVAILERQITATPEHLHRDQGHQLAKLANTVLATSQPDPERAADLGLRCMPLARATGSARIAGELHTLDRTLMRRWPTLPGSVAFHEAITAAT